MQRFQHCSWTVFVLTAVWDLHHSGRGESLVYLQQQLYQEVGGSHSEGFQFLLGFTIFTQRETLFYIPSVVFGCL